MALAKLTRSHPIFFLCTIVTILLVIIAIQHDELHNQTPIVLDTSHSRANSPAPLATPPPTPPPPTPPPPFPKKIWYKAGPRGVSDEAQRFRNQCLAASPDYQSEILTDATADEYVWKWYSHRADILHTYFSLGVPILRADLLRYLILYACGGVWFDLDVSCEDDVPVGAWVGHEYRDAAQLVVGLEFDCAWQGDGYLYSQFASWTIMAKPGSPHLMQVIEDILVEIAETARRNNVTTDGVQLSMIDDVVDSTGPKRMTLGIVKSLNKVLGRELDDRDVGGLSSPRLIHDVLILPANAFAGVQNGFVEGKGSVLVNHHYAGTWKNKFGGEGEKGSEQEKEIEREKQMEYEREMEKQQEAEREKVLEAKSDQEDNTEQERKSKTEEVIEEPEKEIDQEKPL
ncbi:hypothetical protein DSL72_009046 [Monilinia vaccinii-corymbosi]|uniref:Glycosyltransferase family 32 protein n=1 Tax=Monilinia vaccinii-corymbosi TaxID=61207 RepID=A0A8A3PPZ1_9HELO|nr:hypothetical protein DSL72_009046 [Monilinia vaccinii-corymbosi]